MFSGELAEIRFGCGLSPKVAPPETAEVMLQRLAGPDTMAQDFPIETFSQFLVRFHEHRDRLLEIIRTSGKKRGDPEFAEVTRAANRDARQRIMTAFGQNMLRWSRTDQGFRERLTVFWGDHFTAYVKNGLLQYISHGYVEEVIRPRMAGKFEDLLIAVTLHPVMMRFLEQETSVGPDSPYGKKRADQNSGLNENLAREVLELHTLGVNADYSQDDVRQLAELFTGMSLEDSGTSFVFLDRRAQPGTETILGKTYGGGKAKVEDIMAALTDLARNPMTARHISGKLAVHFVSDTPDPALVDHMTARYLDTDGDLMAVYGAMLEHPASWDPTLSNVKQAIDFVGSSCRALAIAPRRIDKLKPAEIDRILLRPMQSMGQRWLRPAGPNGWPEEDVVWVTPQSLAARFSWAMSAPQRLQPDLPQPPRFAETTLGSFLPPRVQFAAKAAEQRSEAIGLVLSSPAFQRR
ncbi:DUF1800 domain-containing protein [Chachezhania sediminis]|uniref:DUF1800 domain-containing protein n=1 Tax=Chachezhania sediminis TaxID=2599291 RepID=UPI00131BE4D4|nr:DUF1800 domain-containing protein [Chachezhania sediminis]